MSQRITAILVLALFLGRPALAQDPAVVAFVDCNLIPMDGERVVRGATVVVCGERIRTVGASEDVRVPKGATVIDADGAWLMPGLTDMHVHVGDESERLLYLRYGVTAVCNLGGDGLDLFSGKRLEVLKLRDRILAGELAGPDIYSTGTALDGAPATGPFQTAVPDQEAAAQRVGEHLARGYDFIKVYDALTPEVHAAIIEAATGAGVAVFGHVPEAVGVEATLASGQAVIAHAEEYFGAYESVEETRDLARLARLTRDARVTVIPNISFIRNVLLQLEDLQARLDRPETRYIAPAVRRWWGPEYNYLVRRPELEAFEQQMRDKLPFVHGLTRALHDEGVLLLAGSDASVPTMVPGLSLHEELAELVAAGLTPYEALCTATCNVRTFFDAHLPDQAEFGVVQVERRANLLLLDRSPLESISNLGAVRGVMVRGRWYARAELDARLAKVAQEFR